MEPFLYNKGHGRYFPIDKLVMLRNCERARSKQFPEIRMLEDPEEEFDIHAVSPEVSEADYLINPSAYREVVWDIKVINAVYFPFLVFLRTYHFRKEVL